MTDKERIEKLKDKEKARPFFLLTPADQRVITKAGPTNRLYTNATVWPEWPVSEFDSPQPSNTYVLKPNYEPDLEVRKNCKLARIIAEHLYTQTGTGPGGENVLVERVVLMKQRAHSHEELLGGLCFASAKTVIEKLLDDACFEKEG